MMFSRAEESKVQKLKNLKEGDVSVFRRVSNFYENNSTEKMKSIHLIFKQKKQKKIPKRTKTLLPTINLSNVKFRQKLNTFVNFMISLMIMTGSFYEVKIIFENDYNLTFQSNILRLSIMFLAIVQFMLILSYYYNSLRIKISYKIISKHSLFYQDYDTLIHLIIELLICCFIIPPYFTLKLHFRQISREQILSIDDIILGFTFLRVYHFYKLYYEFSRFNSLKSRFYCDLQNVPNLFNFTMKCFLKDLPWISILIMFTSSTLTIGVLLHVYEESLAGSPFGDIWNSFWLVSYTQSTIGYGDIVPQTHLGRVVVAFSIFIGLFMYSYIVLIVRNSSELSMRENKLYSYIKYRFIGINKLRNPAAIFLQRWWRLYLKRRIRTSTVNDTFKFQKQLQKFSLERRKQVQDQNPTFTEELKKASITFNKKMSNLTQYLSSSNESEMKALKLANMHYSTMTRLKGTVKRLSRFVNDSTLHKHMELEVRNTAKRVSSVSSRAAIKKMRGNAVKKLIQTKIKKASVLLSAEQSFSSDEEFYSSNNSSFH